MSVVGKAGRAFHEVLLLAAAVAVETVRALESSTGVFFALLLALKYRKLGSKVRVQETWMMYR